ncbi:MAG TPA: AAA family ATPase, partial [Gaiellaceae bacterium]
DLLGPDAGETASHVAMLIGVGEGSSGDRQSLFFSARRLVEGLATERPTVLVFEDIHWADAGMLDLLETLASRVRDVPLLMLAPARPELLENRPAWGGGLPGYTALPIEPLSEEHANELAMQLLDQSRKIQREAAAVSSVGEGNPLFIEELAAALAEDTTAATSELPTSIRAIVAARLDTLPPEERAVLLDASVVGKVFWAHALESMASGALPLPELLDSLEGRDLVRRENVSRLRGDQQYSFKHDLIREIAYATLPRPQRRRRHAQVAAFLEETTSELPAAASAVAHHWREAGENERAATAFVVAGDQAGRGWSKHVAAAFYQDALELLPAEDVAARRDITRRRAVALAALFHAAEPSLSRGNPPGG